KGRVLSCDVRPTHQQRGPEELLKTLCGYVARAQRQLKAKPAAIGLGLCGAVDPAIGAVLLPGKFKGLEGFPIVKRLARRTGVPVVADNDARAAMIAEQKFGLA